tara:strand:+ start:886 stop:1095 length:210 start_codon:yes stop_codon:yes gene_type:complete
MIKVLKATEAQYKALNGYKNRNNKLEFSKDANNNWIISKSVLTDIVWESIRYKLGQLEEIDFKPILIEH